ncbi:hypothetical protein BGZ81_003829 [Podila clonocystis]|nr:hypothetical protein BGZ81_003829 [Podila clonocystis]
MLIKFVNEFPVELWICICSFLYPSQLARLSQTSRTIYEIVASLGIWTKILQQVYPDRLDRTILGLSTSKSHMLYVLALSFRICERCFKYCHVSSEGRACLPLPIRMIPSFAVDHGQDQPWTTRLCLACRKTHFAQHPEPIPEAIHERVRARTDLELEYGFEAVNAMARPGNPSLPWLRERDVLAEARVLFGGDVGLTAKGQSVRDSLKKCNYRQYMYHSRMIVVAAGDLWVDQAERDLCVALESIYLG